jgi:hypothetical protein
MTDIGPSYDPNPIIDKFMAEVRHAKPRRGGQIRTRALTLRNLKRTTAALQVKIDAAPNTDVAMASLTAAAAAQIPPDIRARNAQRDKDIDAAIADGWLPLTLRELALKKTSEWLVRMKNSPEKLASAISGLKGFRPEHHKSLANVPKIKVFVGIMQKYIEQSDATGPQKLMAVIALLGNAFTQAYPGRSATANLLNLFMKEFRHINTPENVKEANKLSQRLLLLSAKAPLPPTDMLGGLFELEDTVAKQVLDYPTYKKSQQWFSLSSLTRMMTEQVVEVPPKPWGAYPHSPAEEHRVDIVSNWLNLKVASGYSRIVKRQSRAGHAIWLVEVPPRMIDRNLWNLDREMLTYREWVTNVNNDIENEPLRCREFLQDFLDNKAGHWYLHCKVVHPQAATVS